MAEVESIRLEPVDALTVTTLVDNVTDILLADEGPARRPPIGSGPRVPASVLIDREAFDALRAEHGFAALHVVGLNSVRPWRHQSGAIRDGQLDDAAALLDTAEAGALRVVALHHQLVGAPWRTRKKPVARRSHVLATLVASGAELIVGGHIHQGAVCERHEFEVVDADARGVVVSTAPGFGRPRPHRHGEARGVLVYSADERRIRVETYIWRDDGWGLTALRVFPRGRGPLAVEIHT